MVTDGHLTQLQLYDAFVRRKRLVLVIAFLATIVVALHVDCAGQDCL
jgi:phosphotransferase system  glucose/maltose/N-acetylglucosamine-specific IIC component